MFRNKDKLDLLNNNLFFHCQWMGRVLDLEMGNLIYLMFCSLGFVAPAQILQGLLIQVTYNFNQVLYCNNIGIKDIESTLLL
jgi:hypothetical protein